MKKILAIVMAAAISAVMLTGCGGEDKSPEQLEQERLEAIAAEEAATGIKYLNSPNLEDFEIPLREFASGISENSPDQICQSVGSPVVLTVDEVYGWALKGGYDAFLDIPLEELRVKSVRENAVATLTLYTPDEDPAAKESGMEFQAVYENGGWVLVPDSGVMANYSFTAPTSNVSCGKAQLMDYAVSSDANGVWTFQIPHMVVTDTMSNFSLTTQLGTFNAIMVSGALGYNANPQLIANMTEEEISEYSQVATNAISAVFDFLRNGADQQKVSSVLVSENLIKGCFPQNEESKLALTEKWNTVTGVQVSPADPTNGVAKEYVYHLSRDNSIVLSTKFLISTTEGECRKIATITMQLVGNEWKIANIVCNDNTNIFSDFSIYNPAW